MLYKINRTVLLYATDSDVFLPDGQPQNKIFKRTTVIPQLINIFMRVFATLEQGKFSFKKLMTKYTLLFSYIKLD